MFFLLENQVVVVTGGGSGIGLTVVERFVRAGARVVIADLSDCSELARDLGCRSYVVDVANEDQVSDVMSFTVEQYGAIDVLVNNAGVFSEYKKLMDTQTRDFQYCHDVNVMGIVNGIKAAVPHMNDGARIVNTSSMAGKRGAVNLASYVASKHAAIGVTKTAAMELGDRNIRVNCVCPTSVNTPMAYEEGGETMLRYEKLMVPIGRICEPEEVAAAIHFLASEDCGFINGQAIELCGGSSAGTNERAMQKLAE